jgi:uncharacterized protein (TIGR03382 family)
VGDLCDPYSVRGGGAVGFGCSTGPGAGWLAGLLVLAVRRRR